MYAGTKCARLTAILVIAITLNSFAGAQKTIVDRCAAILYNCVIEKGLFNARDTATATLCFYKMLKEERMCAAWKACPEFVVYCFYDDIDFSRYNSIQSCLGKGTCS